MIGKDSSGKRLRGGPYTLYQLGGGLLCAITLKVTAGHWGVDMAIAAKLLVAVIVVVAVVLLLGRIDVSNANPIYQATGSFAALIRSASPRTGLRGRRLPKQSTRRRGAPSGKGPASLSPPLVEEAIALTPADISEVTLAAEVPADAVPAVESAPQPLVTTRPLQPLAEALGIHAATVADPAVEDQDWTQPPAALHPADVTEQRARLSPLEQFMAAANLNHSRQDA